MLGFICNASCMCTCFATARVRRAWWNTRQLHRHVTCTGNVSYRFAGKPTSTTAPCVHAAPRQQKHLSSDISSNYPTPTERLLIPRLQALLCFHVRRRSNPPRSLAKVSVNGERIFGATVCSRASRPHFIKHLRSASDSKAFSPPSLPPPPPQADSQSNAENADGHPDSRVSSVEEGGREGGVGDTWGRLPVGEQGGSERMERTERFSVRDGDGMLLVGQGGVGEGVGGGRLEAGAGGGGRGEEGRVSQAASGASVAVLWGQRKKQDGEIML